MLFDGQLENRPFAFENYPVYGPRIYNGRDLIFEVTLVEKDVDEIEGLSNHAVHHVSLQP